MVEQTSNSIEPISLADRFKSRTRDLHVRAERSGVTAQILRGKATRAGYALLLASLAPIYQEMERQMALRAHDPGLRRVIDPAILRHAALTHDLTQIVGEDERDRLAPPVEVDRYLEQIKSAGEGDGARLIAHAYVRYLGDLNGGQALARLLSRSLDLPASALTFYEFPLVEDLVSFRAAYRAAIDQAGREIADPDAVVEEAALAFQLNIDLSDAVLRAQPIPVERTAADSKEALA
jgi:heme oxygenase